MIDDKKLIADEVLSAFTPHTTAQLGGNLGYGVNTLGGDLLPQVTEAIKIWIEQNSSYKLVAAIMTAVATNVITEEKADELIYKIKNIDKKAG